MLKFHTLPDAKPANLSAIVLENDICTLRDQIAEMGLDLEKGKEVLDTLENAIENIRVNGVDDKNVLAILNGGQALEQMCQCKFEELTVEKALEALEEQDKSMWEKFVEKVREIFRRICDWIRNIATNADDAIAKIKAATSVKPLNDTTHSLVKKDYLDNAVRLEELIAEESGKIIAFDTDEKVTKEKLDNAYKSIVAAYGDLVEYDSSTLRLSLKGDIVKVDTPENMGYKTLDDIKRVVDSFSAYAEKRKASLDDGVLSNSLDRWACAFLNARKVSTPYDPNTTVKDEMAGRRQIANSIVFTYTQYVKLYSSIVGTIKTLSRYVSTEAQPAA